MGSNVLTTLLYTIRVTVREVTQKQLLAACMVPGPSAPVVQTVPEHPEGAKKARVFGPVRTVGECGSGSRNEHVGRASSFGMKREKEGYTGLSWCMDE